MTVTIPQRVRVRSSAVWAKGALGTATSQLSDESELGAGEIVVEFDAPQRDGDGDEYVAGFFSANDLEPI